MKWPQGGSVRFPVLRTVGCGEFCQGVDCEMPAKRYDFPAVDVEKARERFHVEAVEEDAVRAGVHSADARGGITECLRDLGVGRFEIAAMAAPRCVEFNK